MPNITAFISSAEDRIEAEFPDDNIAQSSRSRMSRSTQAQARGHVEFPSSESALMTISFLTFAVYLIKLVLVSVTHKYFAGNFDKLPT